MQNCAPEFSAEDLVPLCASIVARGHYAEGDANTACKDCPSGYAAGTANTICVRHQNSSSEPGDDDDDDDDEGGRISDICKTPGDYTPNAIVQFGSKTSSTTCDAALTDMKNIQTARMPCTGKTFRQPSRARTKQA